MMLMYLQVASQLIPNGFGKGLRDQLQSMLTAIKPMHSEASGTFFRSVQLDG
ncbi:hypothetical protein [Oscillatoria sp. HE19RPO]|jgi:hypothetical protein|uniref:hypothetical protein n=1 Tax=Oscillatoria sp. HE19RPO TaxID=2954806 RepID=UPI0020C3349B|nr:hypothetical protein [Oscillatoria sp. HE19RPO]